MKQLFCIIIGTPDSLRDHLAAVLAKEGHVAKVVDPGTSPADTFGTINTELPIRVIFTPCVHDELSALDQDMEDGGDRLATLVGKHLKTFLGLAQAAILSMMKAGGGQIWVLDCDDTFEYHLPFIPFSPLVAEARSASVRTLAKEYSRMGITINSFIIQPSLEMGTQEAFNGARDGLKKYAMRYKPPRQNDILSLFEKLLMCDSLPMAGGMVGIGMGINQGILVQ